MYRNPVASYIIQSSLGATVGTVGLFSLASELATSVPPNAVDWGSDSKTLFGSDGKTLLLTVRIRPAVPIHAITRRKASDTTHASCSYFAFSN
jgi:hypothetical protein